MGTAILIFLAGILTIGVGSNASQFHRSDAAGNGMAEAFGWILAVIGWILLGILLMICASRGGFPRFSGAGALVAFPLVIAAQVMSLQILAASKAEGAAANLLPAVTVVAPLLLLIRVAWGVYPSLRGLVPEVVGAWGLLLLAIAVSLVPFAVRPAYAARRDASRAEAAVAQEEGRKTREAQEVQRVQDQLALIAALPADSDLFSAIPFTADNDGSVRDAARAKARTFTKRQSGAEALIAENHEATLRELPYFDVRLTPAMCEHAKKILASKASLKPFDNDPIRIEDAEREVAPYIESMRWLLANGCDCKPELAGIVQAVGRFADSPRRVKLLADLNAVNPR